ncbi:hypothetical protein PG988_008419 [Apiospora saccharicola]
MYNFVSVSSTHTYTWPMPPASPAATSAQGQLPSGGFYFGPEGFSPMAFSCSSHPKKCPLSSTRWTLGVTRRAESVAAGGAGSAARRLAIISERVLPKRSCHDAEAIRQLRSGVERLFFIVDAVRHGGVLLRGLRGGRGGRGSMVPGLRRGCAEKPRSQPRQFSTVATAFRATVARNGYTPPRS